MKYVNIFGGKNKKVKYMEDFVKKVGEVG